MKLGKFILSMTMVTTCNAAFGYTDTYLSERANIDDNIVSLPEPERLTYAKLTEIVQSQKPSSIEELLSSLSKSYPKHLGFHTFMYNSVSLQSGSYQKPRAIVFGDQADLLFTFNEKGSERGSETIEVMHYKPDAKVFELREISFQNGRAAISGANPTKCMACHGPGMNPRPLWDSYAFWLGAYGSEDDHIFRGSEPGFNGGRYSDSVEGVEKDRFQEFSETTRKRGRYAYLPENPLTFYGGNRINAYLTLVLAEKNFYRIAQEIKNNKKLYPYRYMIAGMFCEVNTRGIETFLNDWREYLPEGSSLNSQFNEQNFFTEYKKIVDKRAKYLLTRFKDQRTLNQRIDTTQMQKFEKNLNLFVDHIAGKSSREKNLMYEDGFDHISDYMAGLAIIYKALGVSTSGLSMSFDPNVLTFDLGKPDVRNYLREAFVQTFAPEIMAKHHREATSLICRDLQARSLESIPK